MSRQNKRITWRWVVLCFFCVWATAIFFGYPPSCSRLSERSFVLVQCSKARNIVITCETYRYDQMNGFPRQLEVIHKDADPNIFVIDLMDGKPPLHWHFNTRLNEDPSQQWVVYSPPLVNTSASWLERHSRERAGGIQYPPTAPYRVVAWRDQTVDFFKEAEFQKLINQGRVTPVEGGL